MNNHPVGLSKTELASGFMIKALMGIVYGWIFLHYFHGDDTWLMHRQSLEETKLLLHDPATFFKGYLPLYILDPANGEKNPFTLFLFNIEYALLVKTLAIANLVSRGNYYLNSIFFNGIIFWGHYWLFNLLNGLYPHKRKWLFAAIFLFLPVVFWLSGIRSDGLLFFFTALLLINLCRPANKMSLVYGLIGFAGIMIMRIEFAMLLAIAIVAYLLSGKIRRPALSVFIMVYGSCLLLFFGNSWWGSGRLASLIVNRQHEFLQLKGTAFHLTPLEPGFISFVKVLPQAVNNSVLRPYIWESSTVLQALYSLETLFFLLLLALAVVYRYPDWKVRLTRPVILLLLFFSCSVYVLVGYTVPFPGAIVRYKCIPELMMICCFIITTDYQLILHKTLILIKPGKKTEKHGRSLK